MISGLSHASSALDNPKYAEYAEAAARFIEKYLYDKEKRVLLRSCYRGEADRILQTSVPIRGFQVDYAFVIRALLDLYEVTFDAHWLEFAADLQDIQDELFWDAQGGGYFSTTKDDRTVILRLKDGKEFGEDACGCVCMWGEDREGEKGREGREGKKGRDDREGKEGNEG